MIKKSDLTTVVNVDDLDRLMSLISQPSALPHDDKMVFYRLAGAIACARDTIDQNANDSVRSFTVKGQKVAIIKFIRDMWHYGLKEAKDMADTGILHVTPDYIPKFEKLAMDSQYESLYFEEQ